MEVERTIAKFEEKRQRRDRGLEEVWVEKRISPLRCASVEMTMFCCCASGLGLKAESRLEGGEDDGEDQDAEEKATAVGDGIDDGVFVQLAARGLEPETADP